MTTMTFQINDASTGSTNPAVWVTITENADGTLMFNVTQEGGIIGDLRGLFFDVADESILNSLVVTAASTDIRIGNDSIKDLGDGANMSGLTGSDKGYDVGIEIGTSGIGKDDVRSYSFTLDSTARNLTLQDFSGQDFAARLTSVGQVDGTRADSSKILEILSMAANATYDVGAAAENGTVSGNVLANDGATSGTTSVTSLQSLDGEQEYNLGEEIALNSDDEQIGSLVLNADGTWAADASLADSLSEGEVITYEFAYAMRNQTEATSWFDDGANLTVRIVGANDGPVANDDAAGSVAENETLSGNVTANDSDVDRLDTHTWSLVQDSFSGQGKLTFNADGTWSYDAQSAYDLLNDGESVELSFQYAMTDNHGASDMATVTFRVNGSGTVEPPPPPPTSGGNDFPTWGQDISHFTLVFDQTLGDTKPRTEGDGYYTVKIDVDGAFNDDMDVSIASILATLATKDANVTAESDLLGLVIKGGLQTTQYYAYGDHNTNGDAADELPYGIGFDLVGNLTEQPTNAIDAAYTYDWLMA